MSSFLGLRSFSFDPQPSLAHSGWLSLNLKVGQWRYPWHIPPAQQDQKPPGNWATSCLPEGLRLSTFHHFDQNGGNFGMNALSLWTLWSTLTNHYQWLSTIKSCRSKSLSLIQSDLHTHCHEAMETNASKPTFLVWNVLKLIGIQKGLVFLKRMLYGPPVLLKRPSGANLYSKSNFC